MTRNTFSSSQDRTSIGLRLDWLGADTQGGAGQAQHSALLEFMDAEGRLGMFLEAEYEIIVRRILLTV